jgi:hypothetical protein
VHFLVGVGGGGGAVKGSAFIGGGEDGWPKGVSFIRVGEGVRRWGRG